MNALPQTHINQKSLARFPSSALIQFPVALQHLPDHNKKWICNVSKDYMFAHSSADYLQIKTSSKHSQFELICRLLDADTCRVIYFDENLSHSQLGLLRERLIHSNTELLNAKVAYLFAKESASLYA